MNTVEYTVLSHRISTKISVIVPCFNIDKYLSKCIESILAQTIADIELILIDDGSTDSTLSICEEYQRRDARVKVFSHQNKGVSYTRNRGIELAIADYIIFIDGDDWIENNMIELLIETEPNADLMSVCGMIHERNGQVFKNSFFSTLIENNKLEFYQNQFITLFPSSILSSPCCKVYNKEILIKNGINFNENLSYQEDLKFNLEYVQKIKKIKIVPAFKYHYVEHKTSSSSRFHKNLDSSIIMISKLLLAFPNYKQSDKSIQIFNIDQVLKLIANYLHKDSIYSKKAKFYGIEEILNNDIFEESQEALKEMPVGKILKILLKNKNITGIMFYFQLNTFIKNIYK